MENFNKLFWGFAFVLVEIHLIAIDILPDPLGYFFIYVGVHALAKNHVIGKKAEIISLALLFISIPTVFVQNSTTSELGHFAPFEWWSIYMMAIGLIKLILVFFIFKLMLAIVQDQGDVLLEKRTATTFKIYMTVMLFNSLFQTFFMNISGDTLMGLMILMIISSIIMEITFLVLLRRFRKIKFSGGNNHSDGTSIIDVKV